MNNRFKTHNSKFITQRSPWAWVPSLYFAEGIPYVAVMTISVIMYKRLGLSNTDITLYTSWLYLPWVIKPLWSPFVDVMRTKRWWIVAMQILLGAAFGGVAFLLPAPCYLQGTLAFFWLMAFSSATHDIAADGFYMLGLRQKQQEFFVGIRSTFYRIATIVGSGFLVMVAGNLETLTHNITYSWALVFYFLAGLFIAAGLYHNYILPRPEAPLSSPERGEALPSGGSKTSLPPLGGSWRGAVLSVRTFFQKPEILTAICFMLFYRMPEGLLAKVSPLFLIDTNSNGGLGMSLQDIGFTQGTVGVVGLTVGGILGGWLVSRDGLKRWLWPMVMAITLPDLVYVYLSTALPSNLIVINACICVEQFGYGLGFTAYMLYLIQFSEGQYKTSHYALCTAFMALSMMIPGMFAGWLQELVGYPMFFAIVVASCAMTYIVSARINK